ncbi:NAD(P)-dependent dehydrogenase (short-subunit alcohol dehydrogenase family) [Brevibacterium sanguinis]|uniref:NAD(P)-dependent dehydrogenase (Short-subunit alcohol dehydrogenase family) n=2 Tax=Brevibacterium TaxID=1696 RepID=A0A366IJ33_9MICO|nr:MULTISPECIES: SDR family oxidoreductase [Brevibacterium]RBP62207.1 NAD(P)-dependent dehydrogenase (short-subunit alcohol dehydrogenase family) [Brevibacterium sanguinis]RBP70661.1 NAD(P)-dependent dehydrogenase (short-subunit alcohol dehydrogenase family) [Brevibacterium celere]
MTAGWSSESRPSPTRLGPRRFEGQVALITGASRGIGLGIAKRLNAEGATVVLTARKPDALAEAVAEFPTGTALGIAGKADDPAHRAEVFDTVAEKFGRLDMLVTNVGINPVYGPTVDIDLDAARKILDVNVLGTLAWVQGAVHHERLGFRRNRGRIVSVSSVAGSTPSPGIGFYGVSKAAISHLTTTLAVELGPDIRVNAVAPAVVKTSFARALYEGREDTVAEAYPLKRLGTPEDIGAAVAYLASSDADWITGQVLTADGGLIAAGGTA